MKISPKIYAKTLVESASSENLKQISRNFWIILQKNKQYRDLPKVMDLIDEEAARRDGKILAKVYSREKLDEKTMEDIKSRLSLRGGNRSNLESNDRLPRPAGARNDDKIILQNIVGKNMTGIVVKADGKIIDLTAESKINKLKKIFLN